MKTISIILIVILIAIMLVGGWFYFFLKVKTQDVSSELPFSKIINKKLILDRNVFLVRSAASNFYKGVSTVVDAEGLLGPVNKKTMVVDIIEKGTPLTITKAQLQASGNSEQKGFIIGTLHTPKHTIPFRQHWGTHNIFVLEHNVKIIEHTDFYTFKKPIWKTEKEFNVNKTYFLPKI